MAAVGTISQLTDRFSKDLERGFSDASGGYKRGDILEFLTASETTGSTADGDAKSAVITGCTGVVMGDAVIAVAPNGLEAGILANEDHASVTGRVTGAGEITISILNNSGGTVVFEAQTYTILVMKLA